VNQALNREKNGRRKLHRRGIAKAHAISRVVAGTAHHGLCILERPRGNEELKRQAQEFFKVFEQASAAANRRHRRARWAEVRAFLEDLSRRRALAGFGSEDTASFVFR